MMYYLLCITLYMHHVQRTSYKFTLLNYNVYVLLITHYIQCTIYYALCAMLYLLFIMIYMPNLVRNAQSIYSLGYNNIAVASQKNSSINA